MTADLIRGNPGAVATTGRRPGYRAEPVLSEVEGRSTQATPVQLLRREPERRDEMRVGLLLLAETAEHLA